MLNHLAHPIWLIKRYLLTNPALGDRERGLGSCLGLAHLLRMLLVELLVSNTLLWGLDGLREVSVHCV